MTEGGFDNENFVSDEVDDTITLLFLGLPRAGKTAIREVFTFFKVQKLEKVDEKLKESLASIRSTAENHLNYLQPTTEIKCNTMQCFKKIKIIDFLVFIVKMDSNDINRMQESFGRFGGGYVVGRC